MSASLEGKLVVAISSRALFDFEEENAVFEQGQGQHRDRAYMALQLQRLDLPAKPGVAFSLVRKLLAFNQTAQTDPAATTTANAAGTAANPTATTAATANWTATTAAAATANWTAAATAGATANSTGASAAATAASPTAAMASGATTTLAGRAGDSAARKLASQPVEVVILSRNDPVSGMRVFRSASHYGLAIQRGSFTRGQPPWRYLKPLHANLFLSAHLSDVRAALAAGVPAAQVYPQSAHASEAHPHEVRIAFDGDAVLFSDEAERVYQAQGLSAFHQHETEKASQPLLAGPFKPLLAALQRLQQEGTPQMRIRTALVTARSAPAHERAIRTLMDWNIEVDEAMFLGGLAKGEFLREFEPDFFFDDQTGHIESAAQHVPSGHVASGIANP